MGNCFSGEKGGRQAVGSGGVGGAVGLRDGGAGEAVDHFLKARGFRAPSTKIEISLFASDLHDRDILSKSDPMVVVYGKRKDGALEEVGRTEVILNSSNPAWVAKIIIDYQFEVVQPLVFRVYDIDSQFQNVPEKVQVRIWVSGPRKDLTNPTWV